MHAAHEPDTLLSEGLTIARSKFMLVAMVLALAAYMPTCFCWTDTVAAWMIGSRMAAVHGCCVQHDTGARSHAHTHSHAAQDVHDGQDHQQSRPVSAGCLTDCGCGVQHRIASQATLTVLDFAPALAGYVVCEVAVASGLQGVGARAGMWGESGAGTAGAGARTLLRLHCALTI